MSWNLNADEFVPAKIVPSKAKGAAARPARPPGMMPQPRPMGNFMGMPHVHIGAGWPMAPSMPPGSLGGPMPSWPGGKGGMADFGYPGSPADMYAAGFGMPTMTAAGMQMPRGMMPDGMMPTGGAYGEGARSPAGRPSRFEIAKALEEVPKLSFAALWNVDEGESEEDLRVSLEEIDFTPHAVETCGEGTFRLAFWEEYTAPALLVAINKTRGHVADSGRDIRVAHWKPGPPAEWNCSGVPFNITSGWDMWAKSVKPEKAKPVVSHRDASFS
mmetsp:Transcript_49863/g.147358  ORF Transcript_49863/g.147358 Transcript_49863/m.147358 type:complete len:272 (+) Transcript_49863:133-948(+)